MFPVSLIRSARAGLCALSLASAAMLAAPGTAAARQDGLGYVFYADGGNTSMGSGDTAIWRRAQALRGGKAPFLLVSDNGVSYVIRDAATLARVKAIMAPQQELGRRQGALGSQQGELGRRQGALGAEQGRLGARMAGARVREAGDLARQQAALGARQVELGRQQAALGARQAELGRQQARAAAAAEPHIRALLADAIRAGVAQRVR